MLILFNTSAVPVHGQHLCNKGRQIKKHANYNGRKLPLFMYDMIIYVQKP